MGFSNKEIEMTQITQTNIEQLLRQIPAVQQALAEEDAAKARQATEARSAIIDVLADTEREILTAGEAIAKAQAEFSVIERSYQQAKDRLVQATMHREQLNGARLRHHKALLNEHGNRIVIEGIAAIESWALYLAQLESEAQARRDRGILADIHAKREGLPAVREALEAMKLEKGHPGEIHQKVEKLLVCIDRTYSPFRTNAE